MRRDRERENDDVQDFRTLADGPEPLLNEEETPRRRTHKDRSESWRTEAGIYKSWRPPNWAAENSRRL